MAPTPRGNGDARVRDGGGYRISGRKTWITNSPIADIAIVWAKLDGTIRGFIVEAGTPGFSAPKISGKLALRASVTGELVLDDVRVGADALLAGGERPRRPLRLPQQGALRHRMGGAGCG